MRLVNLGVRKQSVLQQIREGAKLGLSRGIGHQATKNPRQKPTAEAVWVMLRPRRRSMLTVKTNDVCKKLY